LQDGTSFMGHIRFMSDIAIHPALLKFGVMPL
jgi:hypothetical protein